MDFLVRGLGPFSPWPLPACAGSTCLPLRAIPRWPTPPPTWPALVTFALGGKVLWAVGIPAALFGIAGGYVGAGLALKGGAKVIRPMFFVVLTLLVVRLVWDLLA